MTITLTISDSAILHRPTGDYATTPESVLKLLDPIRDRAQEHLLVITADVRHKVIGLTR